jgi:hypothetical protein
VLSLTEIAPFYDLDLGVPFLRDNGLAPLREKDFWLGLRDHGEANREVRDRVFGYFSERGGYPFAHHRRDSEWQLVADLLNETVVRRVIQHDVGAAENGDVADPRLLEEVFRLATRYAGQAPGPKLFAREILRVLGTDVGTRRVERELRRLGDTLLLRFIPPLELRLRKSRGHPKICLADHALRASWLQEPIPLDPQILADRPELTPTSRTSRSVATNRRSTSS